MKSSGFAGQKDMFMSEKIDVTLEEMQADTRDYILIDVRTEQEFETESLPNAINIEWEKFDDHIDDIAKDKPVYLLCYTGKRSADIAERLRAEGIEAYNIERGWQAVLQKRMEELLSDDSASEESAKKAERSIIKTFRRELWTKFVRAIQQYEMIQDGDRIAVCISGGKDSMLMAKLFQELARHGKKNVDVVYLVMNPGYNELNYQTILDNAKLLGVPITVFNSEIYDIVAGEGESPCYLCARMRRGALYSHARELGCNKIALGHHYDDVIETILMSMLYGGQVQTMMPKLHSQNFPGMELIRPLYLIREDDIKRWRDYNNLNFIACACRFTESCATCGGTGKGSKRADVKELIKMLHEQNQYVEANIFKSMENVHLDTVIAYKKDGEKHNFLDTYYEEKETGKNI